MITNKTIIFPINNTENIYFHNHTSTDQWHCFCETPVLLKYDSHEIILSIENTHDTLLAFSEQLTKVLHGKLQLHESITTDIGYAYNAYLKNTYHHQETLSDMPEQLIFVYAHVDGVDEWVGNEYKFLGHNTTTSWLYNTADGSIVFEVTPVYPYHFVDPSKHADAIPYQKWIKTYKPYVIKTISHAVAQKWLEQANEILAQIEKNSF